MKKMGIFPLILLFEISMASEIAYEVEMSCKSDKNDVSSKALEGHRRSLENDMAFRNEDHLKDTGGIIGIVGGSYEFAGATYLTAMTIYKLGVREVQIFCNKETAKILKQLSPDLSMHIVLERPNVDYLDAVDIVVLGPGLEQTPTNSATLIFSIAQYCRTHKKPLVIDLHAYFLSTNFVARMANFPESGVIFVTEDDKDFYRVYQPLKTLGNVNVSTVHLDQGKFGSNIYILRQGCNNRGIAMSKTLSWISLEEQIFTKTYGQRHMLSGAVAAYYFWSRKLLKNTSKEPMFHAGVATFSASRHIRVLHSKTFLKYNRAMLTSDMLVEFD